MKKTNLDWGQSPPPAPSLLRVRPGDWIATSCIAGAVIGAFALAAVWRPLPGMPLPRGALSEHIGYWLRSGAHALFPSLFAESARFYAAHLAGLPSAEKVGMAARCLFASCAAAMPAILLAAPMLRPRDGVIHIRGSSRHAGPEAVARLAAKLRAQARRRPDHQIAPGVDFPADLWTRHLLVVGGVGSGKSTAIKPLIDKIAQAREQMLIFDPKGEFTSGFGGPSLIAPWDARSLAWDIATDMRNILDMRRFASCMVRDSSDPMWSNAAKQLLVGLLVYLKGERGHAWGWRELSSLVALPQSELLPIMRRWHPEAVRAVEKASVTTAGILINLAAFCSPIFDLAEAWGSVPAERRISLVEWTLGRSSFSQVVLQGHGSYSELTKSYVEGIVGIVSAIVNSVEMPDDPKRKIWFIADEFAQMGKIPVRALFEVGRSRGVRCVVACQDFAQLEELYGAAMVKALIGMCGSILVGQMMPGETAEQLCKAFGAREVERVNLSTSHGAGSGRSTSISFSRDEVPLYKPSELASRLGLTPDGKGVAMILFTGGEAYELVWPHYRIRSERLAHVPAPWLENAMAPVAAIGEADGVEQPVEAADGRAQDEEPALAIDPSFTGAVDIDSTASSMMTEDVAPDQAISPSHPAPSGKRLDTKSGSFPQGVGATAATKVRHRARPGSASPSLSPKGSQPPPSQRAAATSTVHNASDATAIELAELEAMFDGLDASRFDELNNEDGQRGEANDDPLADAVLESSLHAAGIDGLAGASLVGQVADALFDGGAPASATRARRTLKARLAGARRTSAKNVDPERGDDVGQ